MNTGANFNLASLRSRLAAAGKALQPYSFVIFLVCATLLYGFVFMRISTLANTEPSDEIVAGQVQSSKLPRIDESIVRQLQSLQDNSVSVKTLFDEARSNPFQ